MKIKILFAALAAVALIGCGKIDDKPVSPTQAEYVGTVGVESSRGHFDNENIVVEFAPAEDGKTASITINKIKFTPAMPLTLDVTIPGISVLSSTDKIELSVQEVIPYALGSEYPKYTVTNFKGEIVGDRMSFTLNFGSTPTSFSGTLVSE
ncbi:MAG: hypothetical protein K6E35_03040 [Bacteroidales bacterium]|nr:hypothetical protein [Bacteroidales bacterium]